jgi:glycosyltransferase involved in cell wall biosynthesis
MTSGTGIKNKLLEALAAGAPCVATPLACQGLAVTDRRDMLVAEPRAFEDAVAELLADGALRRSLGAAGRRAVAAHHSWEAVAGAYARLYEEIAA